MTITDIFAFAKQETAQVYVLTSAGLYVFWQAGAPEYLLYIMGGLSALYIVGEKVRSIFRPRATDA